MDGNFTVLVVEDDYDIRATLSEILESEGYRVVGAAHGAEALAYLQGHPKPCLILLDLMMPIMNGWQFRVEQRLNPDLRDIPVVVISADSNVREKAASIEANGFVGKPIDLDELLDEVQRICPTSN
jgi:CheY-like chemotaxis protein